MTDKAAQEAEEANKGQNELEKAKIAPVVESETGSKKRLLSLDEQTQQQVPESNFEQSVQQVELKLKRASPNSDSSSSSVPLGPSLPSNIVSTNINNNANNSSDSERRYRPQKYCAVCGDKAIACNFNAVTCESCKAFFRRNAFKESRLKCLFENRCIIDRVTRRFCSKCRLLKCFQIGMKREWILTDEQKQIKRVKIMQNKQSKSQQASASPSHSESSVSPKLAISSKAPSPAIDATAATTTTTTTTTVASTTFSNNNNNTKSEIEEATNERLQPTVICDQTKPTKSAQRTRSNNKCNKSTRDASTLCPDEFDLSNPSSRIHFCSLASQCQFCSLRLLSSSSVAAGGGSGGGQQLFDYVNHHHHHHQHTVAADIQPHHQMATSYVAPPADHHLSFIPAGYASTGSSSTPTSCCGCNNIDQANNMDSVRVQFGHHHSGQIVQQIPSTGHHQTNTQISPQLYLMTPSHHEGTFANTFGMFGGQFGSNTSSAQQVVESSLATSSPVDLANNNQQPQQPISAYQQQLRNIDTNNHFMALEIRQPTQTIQKPIPCANTSSPSVVTSLANNKIVGETIVTVADSGTITKKLDEESQVSGADETKISTTVVQSLDCSKFTGANLDKSGFVIWNNDLYYQPANTEVELEGRLEKLDFLDTERKLIEETIEATKFLFEYNDNHKLGDFYNNIIAFCDAALRRLIKTVKQIKAFRMLNMDDQIILLKTACFKILLLRSTYHYIDEVEGWIDVKTGRVMSLDILKRAKRSLVYERHRELVKKIPEPLRKDRIIMSVLAMILLFDPTTNLKHSNSVALDNLIYLSVLRKYLISTQPDPLNKYECLVTILQIIHACNEEYNVFFSKDVQPEQITPLLIEIFDISTVQCDS